MKKQDLNSFQISLNDDLEVINKKEDDKIDYYTFFLFLLLGSGCNWILPSALFQQIPYFEQHSPQGVCISTYMNASVNIGVLFVVIYIILYLKYGLKSLPYSKFIPGLLILSCLGTFFCGFTYQITINNFSFFIFLCCAIGGTVGSLTAVVFYPFLMQFKNDYISAARLGGSIGIFLCALVAIPQKPGSSHIEFSTTLYMIIFGIILAFSIPAYFTIINNNLGLRREDDGEEITNEITNKVKNPISSSLSLNKSKQDTKNETKFALIDDYTQALCNFIGGDAEMANWLRIIWPYMCSVCFVDFQTWGLLSAFTPFAMKNAAEHGGAEFLALAYQIGGIGLVLALTIYIGASGLVDYHTAPAAPILIICYSGIRFLEAHIITTCFRAVASEVPAEKKDIASRCVGLMDQIVQTFGTIFSTILVSQYATCKY